MRRFQRATDQHGRKWNFFMDIKAGDACTPFRPEFLAPWYPDQRCIRVDPEARGAVNIDYDEQLRPLRVAHTDYRRLMIQAANFFNVKDFNPDRDEPTAQMKHDIGIPPLPLEPLLAAKKDNLFILGKRPYDANRPGDVKLAEALHRWTAVASEVLVEEDASVFAEEYETVEEMEVPPRPKARKQSRIPVSTE